MHIKASSMGSWVRCVFCPQWLCLPGRLPQPLHCTLSPAESVFTGCFWWVAAILQEFGASSGFLGTWTLGPMCACGSWSPASLLLLALWRLPLLGCGGTFHGPLHYTLLLVRSCCRNTRPQVFLCVAGIVRCLGSYLCAAEIDLVLLHSPVLLSFT